MSGLPPKPNSAVTHGKRYSMSSAQTSMPLNNRNMSTKCTTSPPVALLEELAKSATVAMPPPTKNRIMPDLAPFSVSVVEAIEKPPQPTTSSRTLSTSTTPEKTQSTSTSSSKVSSSPPVLPLPDESSSLKPASSLSSTSTTSTTPIQTSAAPPTQQDSSKGSSIDDSPQTPQPDAGPPPQNPPTQKPPAQKPPTQNPPTQNPPTQNPPTQNPPAQKPPTQDPPTQDPPAQNPPTQDPPTQNPPTQNPPTQNPPAQKPPTQDPPTQNPPTQKPPTQNPPAQNPPAQNPPTQDPPTQNPPTQNPPTQNPPAQNPPTQDPPTQNPPTQNPPTQNPPPKKPPSKRPPPKKPPPKTPPPSNPPQDPPPTSQPPQNNAPQDERPENDSTQAPELPVPEDQISPTTDGTSSAGIRPSPSDALSDTPVAPASSSDVNTPTPESKQPISPDQASPEAVGPNNNSAAKPVSPDAVAPAVPTSLETATDGPSPTASTSTLIDPSSGKFPDATPVGGPRGSTGSSDLGVSTAEVGSQGKLHLSTSSLVGICVGSAAGIGLLVLLIWLFRRRSVERREELSSPPAVSSDTVPGDRGMDMLQAKKSCLFPWLPQNGNDPSGGRNNAEFSTGAAAAAAATAAAMTTMTDRTVAPGLHGDYAISRQPPTQLRYHSGHIRGGYSIDGAEWPQTGVNGGWMRPLNPFSDSNALDVPAQVPSLPPAALFFDAPADVRSKYSRNTGTVNSHTSRGRSLSDGVRASQFAAGQTLEPRLRFTHRDTMQSADQFTMKRNKFRSDPFDLEGIESRLLSSQDSVPEMPQRIAASSTYSVRPDSFSSSQYTSGVTSDWNPFNADGTAATPTPRPASKLVGWHNRRLVNDLPRTGTRPIKDGEQSAVMFGRAL